MLGNLSLISNRRIPKAGFANSRASGGLPPRLRSRLQSGVAVAEHLGHPEAGERPRQEDHLADREQEDHLADMERQKNPHHRDKHLHQTRPLSCVGTVVALKELLRDPTL